MFGTVPDILAAAVKRDGAALAIIMDDQVLSFETLDRLSNRIANALVSVGLERRGRVAVCLDKQPLSVACLYAVMKAGGIAVPLDPNGPPGRLAHIVSDCGARLLLTSGTKAARLQMVVKETEITTVLAPDESDAAPYKREDMVVIDSTAISAHSEMSPCVAIHGQDVACLLYTSGSTGGPKGVMISHQSIGFFAGYASRYFGLRPDDILSCHAPFHFDLTLFDLYAGHAAGAAVCLIPQGIGFMAGDLLGYLEAQKITVWQSVPSVLRLMTKQMKGGEFNAVRLAIFAGEPYPRDELAELMDKTPETDFFNIYGSTEMNDVSCYPLPRPLPEGDLPIGKSWGGAELLLLDEVGQELSGPDATGELWVRGPTLSPGYWNDPVRTAERFVQNPTHQLYSDPVYRTGDRAKRDKAGLFHFAGRTDFLVKIRGNRVNPGEVEDALCAHGDIEIAAVIAVEDAEGKVELSAFVTLLPDATLSDKQLRRYCHQHVPNYMVPQHFTVLTELPRTSTGKIDRQALKQLS